MKSIRPKVYVSLRSTDSWKYYRQQTGSKNARNMRSVLQVKLLEFKGICRFWIQEQQELIKNHIYVSFASINLAVLSVKCAWHGFIFSRIFRSWVLSIWNFPRFSPTFFARRKTREISKRCRNCSQDSYSNFNFPIETFHPSKFTVESSSFYILAQIFANVRCDSD